MVRFIIEALDISEERISYAAYTGKAAEVLRKKGNKNSMTLHKLLYDSYPKPGGGFIRRPKTSLNYDVVVVDEVSMVPKTMIELLLNYKIFIIFIGDNFQLPPVNKNEANDLLAHPHIFLDEVMRQAQESEIIRLTMKIRNGENIPFIKGNEVMVVPKKKLVTGHLLWADSIICATNATRHGLNKQMRELLGFEGELCEGEKLIFKANYWEDCNSEGDSLVNGSIGTVINIHESFIMIPNYIKNDRHRIPTIMCDFIPEIGSFYFSVNIDKDFLINECCCVDWRVFYQLGRLRNKIGDILPKKATYGYAITGHAAQGSQFPKVLVIEENFPFNREEHKRWLYTCCTRPEEKLVLVRD